MTKSHSSKAFIEYLNKLGRDLSLFEKAKKDLRLSKAEQIIIEAWNLLRSSKFNEILKITEIKTEQDSLIKSQILLIQAIALHNSGKMIQSIPLFEDAILLMKDYDIRRMKFIAYFNLFNAHQNLKYTSKLTDIFNEWSHIPTVDINEVIALKRGQFRVHCFQNEINNAEQIISELEDLVPEMSELNRLNFHIDLFDLSLKKMDLKNCEHLLEKLKQFRTYQYGAHYKYLKKLIDFNLHEKPLYVYERDFKENSTLFFELSVLKCLEEQDKDQALHFWKKLQNQYPHLYHENFHYEASGTLFGLSLKKLTQLPTTITQEPSDLKTNEQKLIYFLNSEPLISKNELYRLIWAQEPESKNDLTKLQLAISRFNQKNQTQIKYKKGCYYLVKETKKAS